MPGSYDTELAKKLNFKKDMKVQIVDRPEDVDLQGLTVTESDDADGVLVFARTAEEVDAKCDRVIRAAGAERVAWIAYPKGGKLDTDLNRDVLWQQMLDKGVRAVRQIAIDEVWSALRFRSVA